MKHEHSPLIPFRLSTTCCPEAARTAASQDNVSSRLRQGPTLPPSTPPRPSPPPPLRPATTASAEWTINNHNPAAATHARHSPHSGNDPGKSCRPRRRRERSRLSRPRMGREVGVGAVGDIKGGVGRCRRRQRGWAGAGIVVGGFVLLLFFFLFFSFVFCFLFWFGAGRGGGGLVSSDWT